MAYETLNYTLSDGVGILTLNRPAARNALDLRMREEIADWLRAIRVDQSVKAVVITGAGENFCAGGDLRSMSEGRRTSEQSRRRIHDIHVWFPELVNLEKPVIAAVDGSAFGGGFSFALAADYILATPRARFCSVFQRIGLVPDMALLYLLPRLVGLARAKDLRFSARILGAEEARSLGIVHAIFEPERLMQAALEFAGRFRAASTLSLGLAKNILNQSLHLDQRTLAELESYAQALCMDSAYHNAAVETFLRKEKLAFRWEAFDKAEK